MRVVGVPMLKAERISCSGPKLSDAQTRNFEAIKHNGEYYRVCRTRGMGHGRALKAVARKRLRAIYAVMRDRVPYRE